MFKRLLLAAILLCPLPAFATQFATLYVDTGGCNSGSTTQCSGTTDSASASASGAGSTITCSATSGVGASVPGCLITGSNGAAGQLGSIPTDGSQAVFVNCATNTGQKIFFITAVDNATGAISTITNVGTPVTPTGCTAATSDWGIGGRYIMPSGATVPSIQNALRAGDTVIFNNTPATKTTAAYFSSATAGDDNNGFITIKGKTGVRPVLSTTSGATSVLNIANANWWIENLEIKQTASGEGLTFTGANDIVYNVKVSQAGTNGINLGNNGTRVFASEVTGAGSDGITCSCASGLVQGSYLHGNTGNGFSNTIASPGSSLISNVIAANSGRGILLSGATAATGRINIIYGNTIYGNLNSGLEVSDVDTVVQLVNNVFSSNGDAAGEYNVEWVAGSIELQGFHAYNVFYLGTGANNLLGLTPNATEVTTDPGMANPAGGNFTIASTGSAFATGFPGTLLGSPQGFLSMGALQPQGSGGGPLLGN